jgi:hypothetical protein
MNRSKPDTLIPTMTVERFAHYAPLIAAFGTYLPRRMKKLMHAKQTPNMNPILKKGAAA